MKNNLLLIMMMTVGVISFSQSNKFGTLKFSAGAELGGYNTDSKTTFAIGPASYTTTDSSRVITAGYSISGDFGILRFLSVGAYFQKGGYFQEEETGVKKNNDFYEYGVMPKIYLINKDKFNLNLGLGLGLVGINTTREDGAIKTESKFRGGHLKIRAETNYYFTKFLGIYLRLGFDSNNLNLKDVSYTVGNSSLSPSGITGKIENNGIEALVGINFRFSAGGE